MTESQKDREIEMQKRKQSEKDQLVDTKAGSMDELQPRDNFMSGSTEEVQLFLVARYQLV